MKRCEQVHSFKCDLLYIFLRNPNLSGARGGSSIRGRASVGPPNRQRTTGGPIIDRPAAPGGSQTGSVTSTARIPARKISRSVGQRNGCGAGTQRKTIPQGPGTIPQGNQRVPGTLKQALPSAPGKQPCPDISQNLWEMRSIISMQIKQSANHKLSFDQVNKDAFCSVVSKKMQLELERQHESYRARDFFLPPPKKLVPAAAGRGEKAGNVPAQTQTLNRNNRFTPSQSSPIRGNGLHSSPCKLSPGEAIPSTSSAIRTVASPSFAAGRREVVIKAEASSSNTRESGEKTSSQKISPKPAHYLNPIQPSPKIVKEEQISSRGKPAKLAHRQVVTSTSSAMETDIKSEVSTGGLEGDVVVVTSASASPFKILEGKGGEKGPLDMTRPSRDNSLKPIQSSPNEKSTKLATEQIATFISPATRTNTKSVESVAGREADAIANAAAFRFKASEADIKAPSQNLGSNPDYNLNPIQASTENLEEDQSSSNGEFINLAPDPVVTSTISDMEIIVGNEVDVVTNAAESAPPFNTREDGGKAPPHQNSSNQPTKPVLRRVVRSTLSDFANKSKKSIAAVSSARRGQRVIAKSAAARIPPKTRGVARRAPAKKKNRNLANRFNPIKASSKMNKRVSTSPKKKSTKPSPGVIVPWLSAAGRGSEEVVANSAKTPAKRIAPPKKGRKRVKKVTLKQLKEYVPTMPGTDYKMPLLTSIGSYANEAGEQMWVCLVCSKIEPMRSSKPMVCCEICNDWYHFACVGIKKKMPKKDPWYCKRCIHRSSARKI